MSWVSELIHGNITPGQFLARAANHLRDAVGSTVVEQGASFVIANEAEYKAAIEAATRAYLVQKLGADAGNMAANLSDVALNALAGMVDAAARAVDGDPAT